MKQIKKIIFFTCAAVSTIFFGMDQRVVVTKKKRSKTVLDEACLQKLLMLRDELKQAIIMHIVNKKEWWYFDKILMQGANIKIARYNPFGTHIAIGSYDHVHIFDIKQKKEIALCECSDINSLCYHPSGKHVIIGSFQGEVSKFNIKKGKLTSSYKYHDTMTSICHHPSKKRLATGSGDGTVRIFPIKKKRKAIVLLSNGNRVNSVCYDPSGNELVTGSDDGTIRIFDIKKRKEIASLSHDDPKAVCYNSSGNRLIIGSFDGRVCIIDKNTQKQIASMIHGAAVSSVCCHPLQKELVTVGSDGKAFIFKQYDQDTLGLEQLVLKKMVTAWLLIEKPDKKINSVELLLEDVAAKYQINHNEISRIWQSLAECLRADIWHTMWYNIEKYGKRKKKKKDDHLVTTKKYDMYSSFLQTYRKQVRQKKSFNQEYT